MTRILLTCGIVGGLFFIAMDVVTSTMLYPGFDITSQQVSELSAIGAPTRTIWLVMSCVFNLLTLAFAVGVWRVAMGKASLRIAAVLIAMFAVNGMLWVLLAPMHRRGTEFTDTDTMHIVFTIAAVTMIFAFIGLGAAAFGRAFRLYSALTIFAMLAAGAVVSTQVAAIAANEPTPWMGLVERISVHGSMLWMAVFATLLLQRERKMSTPLPSSPRTRSTTV